ncbi:MAG: hypothetical protein VZR53_05800 [Prevotella sp.]|nr:hypothetical protein [Prevotella sp.]
MQNDSIFLQRYKRLYGTDIKKAIIHFFDENKAPLTDQQKWVLQESCDRGMYGDLDMPFQAYSWEKNVSETTNVWWRLTIPFFFIWWLIMALLMPFKWLLSGNFHYDAEDFGVALLRKWYIKLFGE